MIKNRPKTLLDQPGYCTLPRAPLAVDWTSVPELIRVSLLPLGGIQPITEAMSEAAGGHMYDKPSEGEIALFRRRGTKFQLISVVLSVVPLGEKAGVLQVRPFAVTLIPASKRGEVSHQDIEFVAKVDVSKWLETQPAYAGYDPFAGEWSLFGNLPGYLDGKREGYLDEFGIVIDQFFLATDAAPDEILATGMRMPSDAMKGRYEKHRNKLLFTPFEKVEARRVWGAETPIELFLIQALAQESLFPEIQVLIMDDGAIFPSWYHLWSDIEFRHSNGLVTEADLYFPDKRVAVFCDGGYHGRRKQKAKDAAINEKLLAVGIRPTRIPSAEINLDLPKAVARVTDALA